LGLFEFLMVLVSVVIGLGLTEILNGAANLLRARESVRFHWFHVLFQLGVFFALLQQWWEFWDMEAMGEISYFAVLTLLGPPVFLFLIANLLYPTRWCGATRREGGMKLTPTYQALAVALFVTATPNAVRAQEPIDAGASLSDIGLAVFSEICQRESSPNVVFSPLSLGLALALLAEGAEGPTRDELLNALAVPPERWEEFVGGTLHLVQDLTADTGATVNIATSLWVDEGRELAPLFRSRAERRHRATVAEIDLQDPATAEIVNRWASDHTEGRITKVMPTPRRDMTLVMLNAVYFKGLWPTPFDTLQTEERAFLIAGSDSVPVPTMHQNGVYRYFESPEAVGIRLPYRSQSVAAYIALPRADTGIAGLVSRLSTSTVASWAAGAKAKGLSIFVPRFRHKGRWGLIEPLRSAGVKLVLDRERSNLNAFWAHPGPERTWLSDALQGTFMEFDEEGTEAAAVTMLGVVTTGVAVPPSEFRVDRPFLLVLRDEKSGAILFVAQIRDPRVKGT
jgi:serine protease inhibitor